MLLALEDDDQKYEITVFDNFSQGNINSCKVNRVFCGDLRNRGDIEKCFIECQPDLVIHFGALANVGESIRLPNLYYENNVVGSLNLLSVMLQFDVKKIIFSSTCAIYGDPQKLPISETHSKKPINPYGYSKLIIEKVLDDYSKSYGLSSISLRYFNAAGCDEKGRAFEQHDPETHLIPLVLINAYKIKQKNRNIPKFEVFGTDFETKDGTCVRDFIHVTDICEGHMLALKYLLDTDVKGSKFYNLSNCEGFSVLEIIEKCSKVSGVNIDFCAATRRPGDPAVLIGNSNKIRDELGWRPSQDLTSMVTSAWLALNKIQKDSKITSKREIQSNNHLFFKN